MNENQTVLGALIHGPDKYAGPLEGAAAGSWSSGNVEQMSQFFTSVAKVLEFELQRQSFQ